MQEIWKDIKGYEGYYQISNLGRVKSLARSWKGGLPCLRTKIETIMLQSLSKRGYPRVYLCSGIKRRTIPTHILVWESFGSEQRNGHKRQIDHIDNNKLNNNITNLQLVTASQNSIKRSANRPKASRFPNVSPSHKGTWAMEIMRDKLRYRYSGFITQSEAYLFRQKLLISIGENI